MSALRSALAFGGIGQGIGQGLQNLTQILMERQDRQRREEETQNLMAMILPLLLQEQGGTGGAQAAPPGAGMVPGEEAFRPPMPQVSTGSAPGGGSDLDSIFQGLSAGNLGKIKDPASAQAFLTFLAGLEGRRRSERLERERETRETKRRQDEIRLREQEQRTTAREKAGLEEQGELSEVFGMGAALGVPDAQTAEFIKRYGPKGAKKFGEVALERQKEAAKPRGGKGPLTPEEVAGLRATLPDINEGRAMVGLDPISEKEWEERIKFPETAQRTHEAYTNADLLMTSSRQEMKKFDATMKWLKAQMDAEIKETSEERRQGMSMARAIITEGATAKHPLTGRPLPFNAEEVRKKAEAGLGEFAKLTEKGRGAATETAASYARFAAQEIQALGRGGKKERAPAMPLPPVLAAKGITEETWSEMLSAYVGQGKSVVDLLRDLFEQGILNDQDMMALAATFQQGARR